MTAERAPQPNEVLPLSNDELVARLEAGDVAPETFHHTDHVRLAFAYLQNYPTLTALDRFSQALKRFAVSLGKADRYNETITYAYFFLIRERMARCGPVNWEEFASRNSDLLTWEDGILGRYYHEATLKSEIARCVFIFPDR